MPEVLLAKSSFEYSVAYYTPGDGIHEDELPIVHGYKVDAVRSYAPSLILGPRCLYALGTRGLPHATPRRYTFSCRSVSPSVGTTTLTCLMMQMSPVGKRQCKR